MVWFAVASAVVSAVSSISQGNAAAASAKSQANALTYNANIERQNAQTVANETSIKEDQLRRQNAIRLGRERAAAAESGTGAGTGSNYNILEEDQGLSELDALTLRYDGNSQRTGLLQQATMDDYSAGAARASGSAARRAGYFGAVSGLLNGASKAYGMGTPSASANANYAPGAGNFGWVQDVRAGTAKPNPYF